MSIDTLDGLAEGTDLTVRTEDTATLTRLRVGADGQILNMRGNVIDPWFLSGYLAEGRVNVGDFTPPRVGEWFSQNGYTSRAYMVVEHTEERTIFAVFRGDAWTEFYPAQGDERVHSSFTRCEAPEWSNGTLLHLTRTLYQTHTEKERYRSHVNNLGSARNYLRHATDYLTTARNLLEREDS